ncbi:hypothetical protein ABZZ20_07685 [Streptomyces sp. NPDC006430]|uniref:hypothetical protein n=1 Tax=Streptomyces sp. NPDC006430 TaxID=3154299 RepID=UPI0033B077C4
MNPARTAAGVSALLGALLLTGCGIKTTGVIESGAAARVIVPERNEGPLPYFVTPDDRLVPSSQSDDPSGDLRTGVVRLLLGPDGQEKASGLHTELPALDPKQAAGAQVVRSSDAVIEIRLPFKVGGLSALARGQLVCTALSTSGSQDRVVLRGPDTTLDEAACDTGSS